VPTAISADLARRSMVRAEGGHADFPLRILSCCRPAANGNRRPTARIPYSTKASQPHSR
jgi:hypothetical protein